MHERDGAITHRLFEADRQHDGLAARWLVQPIQIHGDPYRQRPDIFCCSSPGGDLQLRLVAEHAHGQIQRRMSITLQDVSVEILRVLLPDLLSVPSFLRVGIERCVHIYRTFGTLAKTRDRFRQLRQTTAVIRYPDIEDHRLRPLALAGGNHPEQICEPKAVLGRIVVVVVGPVRQVDQQDVIGQLDGPGGVEVERAVDEVVEVMPETGRDESGKQDHEDHQMRTEALERGHAGRRLSSWRARCCSASGATRRVMVTWSG